MIQKIKELVKDFSSSRTAQVLRLVASVISNTSKILKLVLIIMSIIITVIEDKLALPVTLPIIGRPEAATVITEPYDENPIYIQIP